MRRREYLKQRRDLERGIKTALDRSASRAVNEKLDLLPLGVSNDRFERDHFKMELKVLDAKYLLDAANRFGIDDVEIDTQFYDPQMHGVEPQPYLLDNDKAKLRRLISQARFHWWKQWAEMIVPILALLVAALALLKK